LSLLIEGDDEGVTESDGRTRLARRLRLQCPAVLTELRTVRHRVQRWAHGHGLPDDVLVDLQLAVGEAVANGIEHAYRHNGTGRRPIGPVERFGAAERSGAVGDGAAADECIEVELELRAGAGGAEVAACVSDRGRWRQAPAEPGYRGRGLALIARLSRDMRVRRTGQGTQVTFAIPVAS
jgi:anti-sigma regulatory factor (Ser/Thr protein kinase)